MKTVAWNFFRPYKANLKHTFRFRYDLLWDFVGFRFRILLGWKRQTARWPRADLSSRQHELDALVFQTSIVTVRAARRALTTVERNGQVVDCRWGWRLEGTFNWTLGSILMLLQAFVGACRCHFFLTKHSRDVATNCAG